VTDLVRFRTATGTVTVEIDENEPGFDRVSRSGSILEASQAFEDALGDIRDAALAALDIFSSGGRPADQLQIEFGVRMNAEVGAVIAKTAVEGHLAVKLTWSAGTPAA
jgi:hypothetical protein